MFKNLRLRLSNQSQSIRLLLCVFGFVSLTLCFLYYWFLRESPPFLLQHFFPFQEFSNLGINDSKLVYPGWLYALPSFVHVVAFSFITLSFTSLSKRFVLVVPLVWLLINIAFEVSQAWSNYLGPLMVNTNWSIVQLLYQYVVNGTYAFSDIVAAVLGVLFVYVVIYKLNLIRSDENTGGKHTGYFRFVHSALLVGIFIGGLISIAGTSTCEDSNGNRCNYGYDGVPIYMSYEELRSTAIYIDDNRPFSKTGKIYVYQNYLLVNSPNEGIHIYDNTDPGNPIHITFINIPGNLDIAIKQDYLYVDSYIDLVTIDIRDMSSIREVHREIDMFPYDPYQNIPAGVYIGPIDREKGVVIGYIPK